MKKYMRYAGLLFLGLAFLASCKTPENVDDTVKTLTDVDVSAYDKWVYLSFETGVPEARKVGEPAPEQWDIALHRENVKTNGGAAMKTEKTALADLTEVPSGVFVRDTMTTDVVAIDMSQMMSEIVVYDTTEINLLLGSWVTHHGMPPIYTVSDKVYVVKTKEGLHAKIKFASYKSIWDKTGFATFSYQYPF